ncbi:DUF262 domain-containing protein [Fibrobacter sp. UWB13]|uniref:DUF262 domain-containing protein n=1 Tax=Fibrobacter sp. UWB13 TaxID=1896204 RepID=UPI000A0DFC25|nr:DUF262 domain-containing protein [Fibrobacter sp. UWB13]SMG34703.1 Protein of unknown function DUF262 [Fibrobacter sp. UWB13]
MLKDLLNCTDDELKKKASEHLVYADIETVQTVLEAPLLIPPYQRPYMWEQKQVSQLLNDILLNKKKGDSDHYRIGSMITCIDPSLADGSERKQSIDIVDGQQRITTLLLILRCLNPSYKNELFNNLEYNHSQSYKHLKQNSVFIEGWIQSNVENEKEEFFNYILDNCELVIVTVYNISEAFQMFDSQNGNGKELEPYNLLKAYHLSAVNGFDNQKNCDISWENAVKSRLPNGQNFDVLKQLFSEQLYRSRIWSKGCDANRFTKKEIEEFKGYRTGNGISYPYQNKTISLLMLSKWMENQKDIFTTNGMVDRDGNSDNSNFLKNFMNVNQDIVDGELFFQYIETYVAMYRKLFIDGANQGPIKDFQDFYEKYCRYKGHHRDGDTYLRELFNSLVFCFYDKFGVRGFQPRYYKMLYAFVYKIRILNKSVFYNTVVKAPIESDIRPFSIITQAQKPDDIEKMYVACTIPGNVLKQMKIEVREANKRKSTFVPVIIEFFEKEHFTI